MLSCVGYGYFNALVVYNSVLNERQFTYLHLLRKHAMNTYNISEIIKMWEHVELTVDQAIGQLMLHIQELTQRVNTLERRLEAGQRANPSPDLNRPGLL